MLALALGGRSIAEWQASMSIPEFLAWQEFHRLFPFDDLHRIHRPAAMVSAWFGGGDIARRLEWLQPEPVVTTAFSTVDMTWLERFGLKPPPKKK